MSVYSPRIHREGDADLSTVESLLAAERFAGLEGEGLAVEIWRFVIERFYHWFEPRDAHFRGASVADPVLLVNSYGFAICGVAGNLLATLCHDAGMDARNVGLPGHRATEVFFDGGWHYFDADLHAYHRLHPPREDTIASLEELIADHTLITGQENPSAPYYLEDRRPGGIVDMFTPGATTDCVVPEHWHTMDFVLRPGAEIIYRWGHEGRWVCHEEYRDCFEKYPDEPWRNGPEERLAPRRTYANGVMRVRPDLPTAPDDTDEGVLVEGDARREGRGIIVEAGGTARMSLHLDCPHPLAGIPDTSFSRPPRDGVVLTLEATGDARSSLGVAVCTGATDEWVRAATTSVGALDGG